MARSKNQESIKSVRRIIYTKLKRGEIPPGYYIIKRESITGMLADLK